MKFIMFSTKGHVSRWYLPSEHKLGWSWCSSFSEGMVWSMWVGHVSWKYYPINREQEWYWSKGW